jgi:ketosteroid isomerase-like protein
MSSSDFDAFLIARERAAQAYVTGDGSALDRLVPHDGLATFFTPVGESVEGAREVARRYLEDAQAYRSKGALHFEIVHKGEGGDLAFWAGYEVASVQIGSNPDTERLRVRVTEVFRRVAGEWKLIHRHAENEEVTLRTP